MNKWTAGLSGIALSLMLSGSAFACNSLSDGEVTKVDTSKQQVIVAKGDQKLTFTPGAKTAVTINGKAATLADVKAGDKVSVDYETSDDVVAIKISRGA